MAVTVRVDDGNRTRDNRSHKLDSDSGQGFETKGLFGGLRIACTSECTSYLSYAFAALRAALKRTFAQVAWNR